MKRSLENGALGIVGAATSITSAVYSHLNAVVAVMAGLLGLIAAAFACMIGSTTAKKRPAKPSEIKPNRLPRKWRMTSR